ncbi:MAG: IMP dehydrogenase [Phycisphaerales bacterium JB043]
MGTYHDKIVEQGITFDDVLLLPRRSGILPSEADLRTRLTRNIILNIPLVSAPMDTVTEASLAIALAQEGGIGIIHKNLDPEVQAGEVEKVKRSASGVITDPVTLGPTQTVGDAYQAMRQFGVSGFPVVEGGETGSRNKGKLLGILTRRDLKFIDDDSTPVKDVMTSHNLVTAKPDTTLEEANAIITTNKVEKLLLVDDNGMLAGLITVRDIDRLSQYPNACVDSLGRLRCGAAVGVRQFDRVDALVEAEVDVIVVDTAHGHSENVLDTVRQIKAKHKIDIIAGNVGTEQGAIDLMEAGADAVKVGIGPGSICTTRVVTGVGVPQISAVMHAVDACEAHDIPVIADGGIRMSGDIAKAIAAGASTVMMGSLFAGLDESPGELVISQGRRYKSYRGMGSEGAMGAGSADRYGQGKRLTGNDSPKFVPEGVEGLVAYRGPLAEYVFQLVGGLRAAMGYCGCKTIEQLRADAQFCRITGASMVESHPHDIRITKESPNYSAEAMARA